MISKDDPSHQNVSDTFKMKNSNTRTILITSLIWVLIGAFIITSFSDNSNLNCSSCERQLEKLQNELVQQQHRYNKLSKSLPQHAFNPQPESNKLSEEIDLEIEDKDDEREKEIRSLEKSWFSEDFSNAVTNPPNWPGENGRPVVIPNHLKEESKTRFVENQFDIVASDIMALNRTIPDQRSDACKTREFPVDLPNTSIIIVYHNEGNSTLLRGLVSIVNKSPVRYIHEIILVDDASVDREYLNQPLDDFVKTLPVTVKIIRNKDRLGLMRSRLVGANAATGDTMTFLDAHIECTNGWLPPLLYEIKKNRFLYELQFEIS